MTALLVATNGGHLAQLDELAPRMRGIEADRLWITFDSPQSRSLLAGRPHRFIPEIGERDVKGVLHGTACARRLMREIQVSAVVSTGSAIALSFLPLAALRGIPAHYIESSARVVEPSLTGRLLQPVPRVRLYRQYPHAACGRWGYAGSVFEGFEARPCDSLEIRRVVVTVGSGVHGFRRLIDRLTAILPPGLDVLWQTGSTAVGDLGIAARATVPAAELDQAIRAADVVVAHAGCGSALTALNAGKLPVLVAREGRHGELVDEHQMQLAGWLGGHGLAVHRTPETLAFADLLAAAAQRVARRADPPCIVLGETP
jgi:UDP-N-acetylglucosamine transferase subunit ALG13